MNTLLTSDITTDDVTINNTFTCPNRQIRSSCPVMYLHGDPFVSLNSNFIVSQGHEQKIVLSTMARLPGNDEDQAWIIQPGYTIQIFKDIRFGGDWAILQNDSNKIASVRCSRLNNNTVHVYNGSTWTNINSGLSGSYGGQRSGSVKVFFGMWNGTSEGEEITTDIFNNW
ncbi:MAG: hypothetical protein EOO06_16835 [Chitinophagaceae bacterium]|nr:MAG: hypothetical protein EOO06_16835 [Chitinophagaceae bacterium]